MQHDKPERYIASTMKLENSFSKNHISFYKCSRDDVCEMDQ